MIPLFLIFGIVISQAQPVVKLRDFEKAPGADYEIKSDADGKATWSLDIGGALSVNLSPIGYVPSSTGNGSNLNEAVIDPNSDIWLIDENGNAIKISSSSTSIDWANINNIPAGFADGVDNTTDGDDDPTNEIQQSNAVNLSTNLVFNGIITTTVQEALEALSQYQEGQQLQLSGTTLSITDGQGNVVNSIGLPTSGGGGSGTDDQDAFEVSYDNSSSGLVATDVQTAIDLLENEIDAVSSGASDGVTTAGTLDAGNQEIDYTVAAPGSNFSVDISGLAGLAQFSAWDQNGADDFSGSWNDLTSIPAGFADDIDNVNDADANSSNELQTYAHSGTTSYTNTLSSGGGSFTLQATGATSISRSGSTVTISSTDNTGTDDQDADEVSYDNSSSGLVASDVQTAIDLLENEIDAVSSGASDGVTTAGTLDAGNQEIDYTVAAPGSNFSVDISGLSGLAQFSAWDQNAADDFDGAWGSLSGVPAGFADDIDNVNDADANSSNELQTYAHSGTTSYTNTLSSGGGSFTLQATGATSISRSGGTVTISSTDNVNDADNSPTNEGILSVAVGGSNSTVIESNSGGTGIALTGGTGIQISEVTAANQIIISSSGGSADGVTTAGTLDAGNQEIDYTVAAPGSNFSVDISGLSGLAQFSAWDQNGADDFSGSWNDLTSVPAGFADDIDNVNDADANSSNELQTYAHSGTTSYTNTLSSGGGSFTLQAAGATSISRSGSTVTISSTDNVNDADNSPTNEGSLNVLPGDNNSSIISSNTSGSNDITLIAGRNIELTESGNAITINQVGSIENFSPTSGTTTITFSVNVQERFYVLDMTNANTSSTITLQENPVQDPFEGGVYTFQFKNTSNGPYDLNFPNNFFDQAGQLWDSGSTYEVSADFFMSCFYDGTNFYCK